MLTVLVDLIIIEYSTRRQSMAMAFFSAELLYADPLQLFTLILSNTSPWLHNFRSGAMRCTKELWNNFLQLYKVGVRMKICAK